MSNETFFAWKRRCGDILDVAAKEAMAQKQPNLGVEALFVAMTSSAGGGASATLRRCGIDPIVACEAVRREKFFN